MAFDIFIQYLPRHFTVYYTQLKSLISKIQRSGGSIEFVQKLLYHKVVSIFAKLKGQFINKNEKLRTGQAILKSHLVEHKKHLRTLCLGHEEISHKIKSNYGRHLTSYVL